MLVRVFTPQLFYSRSVVSLLGGIQCLFLVPDATPTFFAGQFCSLQMPCVLTALIDRTYPIYHIPYVYILHTVRVQYVYSTMAIRLDAPHFFPPRACIFAPIPRINVSIPPPFTGGRVGAPPTEPWLPVSLQEGRVARGTAA